MDISNTLAPNSDQLDAIELLGKPRVFKISKVTQGNAEQPVQVHLEGFPRPWRPGKSMRRVLASCWGTDASVWVGRSVKLFCDETIRFGPEVVGGTRIEALSHIDGVKKIPLLVSRGKSATYVVKVLTEEAPSPAPADPEIERTLADLRARYEASSDEVEKADLLAQRDRLLAGGAS